MKTKEGMYNIQKSEERACNRVYGKALCILKKSKIENVVDRVIYTRL